MTYNIAILSGDGIGPEVMEEALSVLSVIERKWSLNFVNTRGFVGGSAIDNCGTALPQETIDLCSKAHAILFGSIGGPKWETLPAEQQPERAALLPLRKYFELFANLRPAMLFKELAEASPLKESIIKNAFDVLIVRELTGGIYFGSPKEKTSVRALDTMLYHDYEIERIAHLAFELAQKRKKRVVSVDKSNVLNSMVLWREIVTRVGKKHPSIELQHMYVDNAAMQLVYNPNQFDVLLCPNLFGDILSDEASMLTGSLGMLASASLGLRKKDAPFQFGLYEPVGGSAPDIAGKGIANPLAQILSLAMLLKYSLNLISQHDAIVTAINATLQQGFRTKDIYTEGCTELSTHEMGQKITEELAKI